MKREGMSPKHARMVAQLPSLVSGAQGETIVPHHLLRTGEHGAGRKSSDRWAVPLTHAEHQALHASGDEDGFFAKYGIDARQVAADLWAARGDEDAMRHVIHRANAAIVYRYLGM